MAASRVSYAPTACLDATIFLVIKPGKLYFETVDVALQHRTAPGIDSPEACPVLGPGHIRVFGSYVSQT
jgi:hypothetical protein